MTIKELIEQFWAECLEQEQPYNPIPRPQWWQLLENFDQTQLSNAWTLR